MLVETMSFVMEKYKSKNWGWGSVSEEFALLLRFSRIYLTYHLFKLSGLSILIKSSTYLEVEINVSKTSARLLSE